MICPDSPGYGRLAMEESGHYLIGLTDGHPFRSLAALCRAIGWNKSNASRVQSGEQSPSYETVADAYAAKVLPLKAEEAGRPLDPRMYHPTFADCDPTGDGRPCQPDDIELVARQLEGLLQTLRSWRGQPGARREAVNAVARAISATGQRLSHLVRHEGGEGAGEGI